MGEKIGKVIAITIFWIIVLAFLGGFGLIKNVFFGGAAWIYVIIRQGIIITLIVGTFYLLYDFLSKNKTKK